VLVILTISGQELLWTIGDAETRYTRGPMFEIFTNVCMFYYFFAVAALLTNMPAMTFSKDISTGKYLACNQSFAEYAHKDTPEGVVGLTDHEIFDKDTADHFVEDDQKALSMDGEAYVFFEDVPDAGGVNIRNLQTTKITFTDDTGRLCLLGMCVDVTEMTRIHSYHSPYSQCL
jgi:hypothetical protein